MVVVDTNVTPGRDFDTLRMRIENDAARDLVFRYGWDETLQRAIVIDGGAMPFTVNVQNAVDSLAERTVSITAWKAGAPVFVREASFVAPLDGTKRLRLLVDALCFSDLASADARTVRDGGPDAAGTASCGPRATCIAGRCATRHVEASTLPEYDEAHRSGFSAPGDGECVDVLSCFERPIDSRGNVLEDRMAQVVLPRPFYNECAVDVGALRGREDLTVAVALPSRGGICSGDICFATLDRASPLDSSSGWFAVGGRLFLPPRVCELGLRVLVHEGGSEACPVKTSENAICSEWNSRGEGGSKKSANRIVSIEFEAGGEGGVVCAARTPSAELCAQQRVRCGEILVIDPLCDGHARMAPCRGRDRSTSCASEDRHSMKFIEGGTFMMGSRESDIQSGRAMSHEGPLHPVRVASFWLDTTEVTAGAFEDWCDGAGLGSKACSELSVGGSFCTFRQGLRDHPMNCVDWYAANEFCAATGKRLPTEEEWEYAARGGDAGWTYPWGDSPPTDASRLCWSGGGLQAGTCSVGERTMGVSRAGVQDLAGNVWEWTASGYGGRYDADRSGFVRSTRGGCWYDDKPLFVRATHRLGDAPTLAFSSLGFRCAR